MLMARALSALAIMTVGNIPMYLRRRCLSMVRICSNNIIEFLSRPSKSLIKVCVGSFAFVCIRLVIGAIMTVGLTLAYYRTSLYARLLKFRLSANNRCLLRTVRKDAALISLTSKPDNSMFDGSRATPSL